MAGDFYSLLGVPRDAGDDEIKKAYRKVAMKYHPDRSDAPDAEERFKEVTRAYEVLRDPQMRRIYDTHGEAGLRRGAGAGAGGHQGFGGFDFGDAFEVFMREFGGMGGFGDIFGRGGGSGRGPRRGSDLKLKLEVSLADAAVGVERTLKVKLLDTCDRCEGAGSEPGTQPIRCSSCGGSGEVRHVQRSMLGQFMSVQPCPTCKGSGEMIESPCTKCEGATRVRVEKTIKIEIPAGISGNDYLRLSGRGNAGMRGGPRGDLLVAVQVADDADFERVEDDLVYNLAVTFSQAALGAEVEVPTVTGDTESLDIPAGVQSGQVLRLRGHGMPRLRRSGRGDQLVRVLVWTPTHLSRDQRQKIEDLADVEESPPAPNRKEPGFWERVRQAFSA